MAMVVGEARALALGVTKAQFATLSHERRSAFGHEFCAFHVEDLAQFVDIKAPAKARKAGKKAHPQEKLTSRVSTGHDASPCKRKRASKLGKPSAPQQAPQPNAKTKRIAYVMTFGIVALGGALDFATPARERARKEENQPEQPLAGGDRGPRAVFHPGRP
jgi:hypothetical protein